MAARKRTQFFASASEALAAPLQQRTVAYSLASTREPVPDSVIGSRLTKEEILIAPECPKVCQHLVEIIPFNGVPKSSIMPAEEIIVLLHKNGLHEEGPGKHEMWDHFAAILPAGADLSRIEDAVRCTRRYRKSQTSSRPATTTVDKRLLEYRKRLVIVLKTQIATLKTSLVPIEMKDSETLNAVTAAAISEKQAQLAKAQAEIEDDQHKLVLKSQAAHEARMKKRLWRPIAGTAVAHLNHKNRNKLKAHDNTSDAAYPPTMQNTVSKQNLPNANMPIANTPWLFRANFNPHSFPSPSIASHAPRATITHSASGEIGCAGARSTAAALFVTQEYAALVATYTGTEMQIANSGEVNAAASCDFHIQVDLEKLHKYYSYLNTMMSTYEPTLIGMHRLQEKVRAAAERKGIAINTYGSAHLCIVGASKGSREMRKISNKGFLFVIQEAMRRSEIKQLPTQTEMKLENDTRTQTPTNSAASLAANAAMQPTTVAASAAPTLMPKSSSASSSVLGPAIGGKRKLNQEMAMAKDAARPAKRPFLVIKSRRDVQPLAQPQPLPQPQPQTRKQHSPQRHPAAVDVVAAPSAAAAAAAAV